MGPPRSVVADVIGAGVMVWNDDPGAVAALPVDAQHVAARAAVRENRPD